MDDYNAYFLTFVTDIVVGIILTFTFLNITDMTYKDGQIDALTGEIHYHMVVNEDSTRTWELLEVK